MLVTLYNLTLAAVFALGLVTMVQPHQQTHGQLQTLEDIQQAGIDYIGEHCHALPATLTDVQLQASNHLADNFNNQEATFTWQLADHPVVSINVSGNANYLAFLARHTLGEFAMDGSYSFIPSADMTFFRAANSSYNLFVYDDNDFSCGQP